jgi:hypothetical protein
MNCGKSVSGKKIERLFVLERMKMSFTFCVTAVRGLRKSERTDKEKLAERLIFLLKANDVVDRPTRKW